MKIPRSVEEAETQLGVLGALIHAREWERAAILATFVSVQDGPGLRNVSSDISPVEFASKGIAGLRSHNTVRRYVDAWLAVRPRPKPGDEIDLDGLPDWPPNSKTDDPTPGAQKVKDIKSNANAVATAMEDPEFAARMVERMSPAARYEVGRAMEKGAVNPPPPMRADLKAMAARLEDANDSVDKIATPILNAAIGLHVAKAAWDDHWQGLPTRDKNAVADALHEIQVDSLFLTGMIEMESME